MRQQKTSAEKVAATAAKVISASAAPPPALPHTWTISHVDPSANVDEDELEQMGFENDELEQMMAEWCDKELVECLVLQPQSAPTSIPIYGQPPASGHYPFSGQLSSSPPPHTNPPVIARQHQPTSAQGLWLPPGSAQVFASGLSSVSSLHSALPALSYKPPPRPPPGHFSTHQSQQHVALPAAPSGYPPQTTYQVHPHARPPAAPSGYLAPTAHQQQHAALGGQRPLPPGWTEMLMPDGRTLYRNELQFTYERPQCLQQAIQEASQQLQVI